MTEEMVAKLLADAETGDPRAQYTLGCAYYLGDGVEQDQVVGAAWMLKAAEQGEIKAQHTLGMYYYKGTGVEQDYAKAAQWLEKAAEQGDLSADDMLGACYHMLAIDYYCGNRVEQDCVKAMELFRKAADRGLLEAQYAMGINCAMGVGVEQDYRNGFNWLCKAMELEEDTPGKLVLDLYKEYGQSMRVAKRVTGFTKKKK